MAVLCWCHLQRLTTWVQQPGLPHFVALSVAVMKRWPGGDRVLGLPPGKARQGPFSLGLEPPGVRQGQETEWHWLHLCPYAGLRAGLKEAGLGS